MSVWATGDIHGNPVRLNTENFFEQKNFSGNKEENIIIILGDFGLVWEKEESRQERYWLDWLENKPFTTVFVDGNHENHLRLAEYPQKIWHGGRVHEIRPHVLHLMRGEMFLMEGKKFFAFGGAASHDISDGILDGSDPDWKKKAKELDKCGKCMYRVKGLTWWEEELPSKAEMRHGLEVFEQNGYTADYIITHSPSTSELFALGGKEQYKPDVLTTYLEELKNTITYGKHLFGHMHIDQAVTDKDLCLYEQIVRIL